jgi:TPR repeat protein/Zn-dependent protease with chaperone function
MVGGNAMRLAKWTIPFLLAPSASLAGVCDLTWDGDAMAQKFRGRSGLMSIRLQDKNQQAVDQVSLQQVLAFQGAKERISRSAGISPKFIICSDKEPNAFAMPTQNGAVVGVTVGMLKLVDGNHDQAGYILGHEIAHHTLNHSQSAQARDAVIGLIGLFAGVVLEKNTQRHYSPGLGFDIAQIGSALVSAKFTRDQEREADDHGIRYMVSAGYNPNGAIDLASTFVNRGIGGIGLFYDSHPGWEEREERFRTMIAQDPSVNRAFNRVASRQNSASTTPNRPPESAGVGANAQMAAAQSLFIEASEALKNNNLPRAVEALRDSVRLGYAPAQALLGYLYAHGRGVEKSDIEASRLFRQAADQGNALAQTNLGYMYATGRGGLSRDDVEAVRLYRLAVDQGETTGQVNLGGMYLNGLGGLAKDQAEAVRLYRLAADRGHAQGRANLGMMYSNGIGGVTRDDAAAVALYRLSADQGNPHGQSLLAIMYATGRGGLAKDEQEALRLSRLSAEQGHPQGQVNLGVAHAYGLAGLAKDDVEAVRYYQLAAAQGFSQAQALLAMMYAAGRGGLQKEESSAARLYRLAADQGNATGQAGLAFMFAEGLGGLSKDDGEAIRLFRLAAAQGNQAAKLELGKRGLQ